MSVEDVIDFRLEDVLDHLASRVGRKAADKGIELLFDEATDVPSLTGFLIWMETDDVTVKRQMDAAGDKIRVMTAHGAKGLEAPIVILPDTADRNPPDRDEIYLLPGGVPVWRTPADASPLAIRETRARRKADQTAENARLLYVALTRPRTWLIVAGAGEAMRAAAYVAVTVLACLVAAFAGRALGLMFAGD